MIKIITIAFFLFLACCDHATPPSAPKQEYPDFPTALAAIKTNLADRKISIEEAGYAIRVAFKDFNATHDRAQDSVMARLCLQIGKSLIDTHPAYAPLFLRQSLKVFRDIHAPESHILEACYRLLMAYKQDKNYSNALGTAALFDSLNSDNNSQIAFKNKLRMGQIYYEKRELSEAKSQLEQTYKESINHSDLPLWIKTDLMVFLSYTYRDLKHFQKALEWGKSAALLEIKAKSSNPNDTLDPDESGRILSAIANAWNDSLAHVADKRSAAFNQAFQNAAEYSKQVKALYIGRNKDEVARASANLGELYRRAGKLKEAETELVNALQSAPSPKLSAHLYINLGETKFDQGALDIALSYYDSALYHLPGSYKPKESGLIPSPRYLNSNINRQHLAVLLADMAHANFTKYERSAGRDLAARHKGEALYDTLQVLFNVIRSGYVTEEAKLELAKHATEQLRQAFGWYRKLYQPSDKRILECAFQIAEQCKAFAMIEAVRSNNYQGIIPEALDERERHLLSRLSAIEQDMVGDLNNEPKQQGYIREKQQVMNDLVMLKEEIQSKAPAYFAVRYAKAPWNIHSIQQKLLGEGQHLVEYFLEDSIINIFIIPKNGPPSWITTGLFKDTLTSLVKRFQSLASRPFAEGNKLSPERDVSFCQTTFTLYKLLLRPIEQQQGAKPTRLIIIPDQILNDLPFEALVTDSIHATAPVTDSTAEIIAAVQKKHFVLFQYAVSYCFSANLLAEMVQKESPKQFYERVATFAPSYESPYPRQPHPLFPWFDSLSSMGHNQYTQLQGIERVVKSKSYKGLVANKANFMQACRENTCVQAIAHAFLDENDPNLSCVVFSQRSKQLDTSNLLLLRDLYAQKWNTEFIGFSSCKTARGPYKLGESNMSFARGLACAGVKSFTTTLWDIPLDGAAFIFPSFYDALFNKQTPKDIALAEAKRSLLENAFMYDEMHPKNWAGITLIGSTAPIKTGHNLFSIFAALSIAGILFLWTRRRWHSVTAG